MNFGSLFAGIGGFDLGFERAGMVCSWQVEIDDYCTRVLEKHWPNVTRYKDVRDVGKHNLEPVDLICGGFPCQPHSVAGKRRGAADDRDLWPEYRRVIDELRPRWVIGENVPGIRTTILDQVLSDLEDMAYTTGTLVIPACAFNAPHRRERIFVIANAKSQSIDERSNKSAKGGAQISQPGNGGSKGDVRHATVKGLQNRGAAQMGKTRQESQSQRSDWWAVEPDVGRVAHGIPFRVDRLRALGNAVVPQVAEFIGKQIMELNL